MTRSEYNKELEIFEKERAVLFNGKIINNKTYIIHTVLIIAIGVMISILCLQLGGSKLISFLANIIEKTWQTSQASDKPMGEKLLVSFLLGLLNSFIFFTTMLFVFSIPMKSLNYIYNKFIIKTQKCILEKPRFFVNDMYKVSSKKDIISNLLDNNDIKRSIHITIVSITDYDVKFDVYVNNALEKNETMDIEDFIKMIDLHKMALI